MEPLKNRIERQKKLVSKSWSSYIDDELKKQQDIEDTDAGLTKFKEGSHYKTLLNQKKEAL